MRTVWFDRIYRSLSHVLFVALVVLTLTSSHEASVIPMLLVASAFEAVSIIRRKRWETSGIYSIVFGIMLLWLLFTCYGSASIDFLFPDPVKVFDTIWKDRLVLGKSILSSLWLLVGGAVISLVLGVGFALFCYYHHAVRDVTLSIAGVLSAIPSLVYAPYAVAVFPGFKSAALFIIACGLFWPTLINMINVFKSIDTDLKDYAKTLMLSKPSAIIHVLIPYGTPSLMTLMTLQVSSAFLLLIGAELMGMSSGVGWYVKYNTDYSDYTKVLAGFIVIAVLVSLVNFGLLALRKSVLKWKGNDGNE